MAVNEAIMLDSAKPTGGVTDDSKPLYDRQTELADLVQNMTKGANKSFDGKVRFSLAPCLIRKRVDFNGIIDNFFVVY